MVLPEKKQSDKVGEKRTVCYRWWETRQSSLTAWWERKSTVRQYVSTARDTLRDSPCHRVKPQMTETRWWEDSVWESIRWVACAAKFHRLQVCEEKYFRRSNTEKHRHNRNQILYNHHERHTHTYNNAARESKCDKDEDVIEK